MLYSFKPIVSDQSKIVILGTMPGVMSLKKRQYYGNENNQFWKIIYAIFDRQPDTDYEQRKMFLHSKKIALWDVINCCYRQGSLDSNIRKPVPNNITTLLEKHRGIKAMFFNGKKANELYRRMISKNIGLENHILPSTSPARTLPFEEKLSQWMKIRKVLDRLSAND